MFIGMLASRPKSWHSKL